LLINAKDGLLRLMKNLTTPLKQRLVSKYTTSESSQSTTRSTDINILLNRVKSNKKQEIKKKFYFSAVASTGLILFGLVIFS
tara:strand:+ start:294 stop:539 length:246 start_codon:yes stop_codon:yes gene_type:complete